jgi:hypothetical protein
MPLNWVPPLNHLKVLIKVVWQPKSFLPFRPIFISNSRYYPFVSAVVLKKGL